MLLLINKNYLKKLDFVLEFTEFNADFHRDSEY